MLTKKPSTRSTASLIKEPGSSSDQLFNSPPRATTKPKPSSTTTKASSKASKTQIIVKLDIGFGNTLYVRGNGATLSWNKGTPMKNISKDEWLWETDEKFSSGEFKVLINDGTYELGPNHQLQYGKTVKYTPSF